MLDDPRPELNDTEVWTNILMIAALINTELAYTLHGFRCAGLRALHGSQGYVLRPEFNSNSLWETQADYDRDKQQFLVKYGKEIVDILNRLGGKS